MFETEPPSPSHTQVNGRDFTLAFRTILSRERNLSGHSFNAWAYHAQVDVRSLNRFVTAARSIGCGYAWRLCTSLDLHFSGILQQSIELAYRTGPGGRPASGGPTRMCRMGVKPLLHTSPCKSAAFTKELSSRLAAAVKESGLSLTAIAEASGLSRPTLSRLGHPGRCNHSLSYLFDLTHAIARPLDQLAREVEDAALLHPDLRECRTSLSPDV